MSSSAKRGRSYVKPRGYPDRRGMGAQSDFLSESFVPEQSHRAAQIAHAKVLITAGVSPESVADLLTIPIALLQEERSDEG